MKTGKFRNVNFSIEKMSGYGHYKITATYRGMDIVLVTTDSQAWDWIDDDSDTKKHNDARRRCYAMIVSEYKRQKME